MKFQSEKTAIDTRQALTAKLVVENLLPNDKILDYGCGTGRNIRYIKDNAQENITIAGCDIMEQLYRNAEKHNKLREQDVCIFLADQVPENEFDIVLNSHVLNVIADDEIKQSVVNNIYKTLKEGGHALIEVRTKKDVEGAKHKVPYGDGWHITKTNTYQEGITKEKMIELVTNAGFTIEEHVFKSNVHYIIVQKLEF